MSVFEQEQKKIEQIKDVREKQNAQEQLAIKKIIFETLPELNRDVNSVAELTKTEIKAIAVKRIQAKFEIQVQRDMFSGEVAKQVEQSYDEIAKEFARHIIEIPRITIMQSEQVDSGFYDFDLDVQNLNYQPGSEEIIIQTLRNGEIEYVESSDRRIRYSSLENIIVSELMNHAEIDYDAHAELLFKLAHQAVEKFRGYLEEDKIANVILYHKRDIGKYIHVQLMEHFYYKTPDFQEPIVRPFTRIETHNLSKYTVDKIYDFRETITPANTIPSKVFSGFKKACHDLYKFDSKTEKDFAIILEQNANVLKWLRPAVNQFNIYYNHNSQRYCPDFVAETNDSLYLIETKKEKDIESREVQEKSLAAVLYCTHATNFTQKHHGKPWKYVLLPHDAVQINMSFNTLVQQFEYQV
ncbi:MAG: hypothetical protein ACOY90_12580 [Candidatus Zhuqueibacterota bacterium]